MQSRTWLLETKSDAMVLRLIGNYTYLYVYENMDIYIYVDICSYMSYTCRVYIVTYLYIHYITLHSIALHYITLHSKT